MKWARKRTPSSSMARWPGGVSSTPWGRVVDAYDKIIDHVNADASARILLAAGSPETMVRMHEAAQHYLPQAGGVRRGGIWFFPNGARARIHLFRDEDDLQPLDGQTYTMVVTLADAESEKMLETVLAPGGRFVPLLGMR